MSKMRYINTRLWDDSYVASLKPEAKLLFVYLITNSLTELCGAYEISTKRMELDTGIREQTVTDCLSLFESGGKMIYRDGWLYVKNFAKHQHDNPSIQLGITQSWLKIPEEVRSQIDKWTVWGQSGDRLSHTERDTDIEKSKKEIQREGGGSGELTPSQKALDFFTNIETQETLLRELLTRGLPLETTGSIIREFVSYWTEPNPSGTRQRWQMQPTFDVKRRLSKWFKGQKAYSSKNIVVQGVKIYE